MSDKNTGVAGAIKFKDANDMLETINGVFLAFVDAIGKPISDLIVKIVAGGKTHELRTDHRGHLPVISFDSKVSEGTVMALMPTGLEEEILKFRLDTGVQSFTCQSPYLLVKGQTDKHEGTATDAVKRELTNLGDTARERSKNGNPVIAVATKKACPNEDNLYLYPNEQYKPHILAASKLSKIIPQAITALINAEAGRIKTKVTIPVIEKGKLIKGADGKPKMETVEKSLGEWRADSTNPGSSARGLTQFLKGTWKGQAIDTSTHLHAEAVRMGYVEKQIKTEIVKKEIVTIKAKNGKPAVLGQPAVTRDKISYVIKEEIKLLELRVKPEFAIIAAVEYGMQNMKSLRGSFSKIDSLNDSDKAKLFYLMHHLGVGDAKKFIMNKIEEEDIPVLTKDGKPKVNKKGEPVAINGAKTLLIAQVTEKNAKERAKMEESCSYVLAHRRWLIKFIDTQIVPKKFACDDSSVPTAQLLFDLLINIGGSHPVGFVMIK